MQYTLVTGGNIVDIENKKVFPGQILIEDGIIKEVGEKVAAPEGCQVIDVAGNTVLPGLFNCHEHMTMAPDPNPEAVADTDAQMTMKALHHLEQYIETGVTYVRDVGSSNFIDIDIRDAVKSGLVKKAPDMQVSGQCICMTGGHGWNAGGRQADGVDELRKAAREQLRAGADWLKIMATGGVMTRGVEPGSPQLTEEEMRAAIEEGHKVGAKSATHAQGNIGIKNAIRAGIDSVEHGIYLDDEAIELMLKNGTWLVATLCAPYYINKYGIENGIPEYAVRKSKMVIKDHYASFIKAYRAGVKCALGTDSGTPFNSHAGTGNELVLSVGEGLTPLEAIELATINSATMLGVEKELGSIAPGKKAHLAVFAGNPADNIQDILNCVMTIKNGEVLYSKL